MKAIVVLVGIALAIDATAALISTNDAWDISQGASVTANSGVKTGSDMRNTFGGAYGTIEVGNTLFPDDYLAGHVHWVEWQTTNVLVVTNINLVASHDGDGRDANERGFSRFTLYVWNTGVWHKVYEYYPSNPYGGGPNYPGLTFLELNVDLTNTIGQRFRAEFVQYGDRTANARGPRITELDGYGYALELPPPMITEFSASSNRTVTTTSHPSALYDLEYRQSLLGGTWTNVPGASAIRGQANSTVLMDTNITAETTIFYRVKQTISP
mgnify:CR=1 FL=1